MLHDYVDFNGANEFFEGAGSSLWSEMEEILDEPVAQLQASDQAGKIGSAIFDPKATNACLTKSAGNRGWRAVPVPDELKMFGVDWDSGKGSVLAEWQFSNYPFLWNNIIRSEAVFKAQTHLTGMDPVQALIVVTKSGRFPSSNSTLYYEQARAQIDTVTTLNVFDIPIRLVGLMLPTGSTTFEAAWNTYEGRYSRRIIDSTRTVFTVTESRRARSGFEPVSLRPR